MNELMVMPTGFLSEPSPVITVTPVGKLENACLNSRGIRHIPVVDRNQVIGIVSVGDVVKETMSQLSQNASFLETFIKGHSG